MNIQEKRWHPMLAEKADKAVITDWSDWIAETKYDGHRVLIFVGSHGVEALSRPRKDGGSRTRVLPPHVVSVLNHLPWGVYDGEDMAGDTATDVKRLDLLDTRHITLFDVLFVENQSTCGMTQTTRREALDLAHQVMRQSACIAGGIKNTSKVVQLATQHTITSGDDVKRLVESVWKSGGEGLILKHKKGLYQSGKRSTNWIKIKKLEHFTLEVIGWEASRGTVLGRGPFAIVKLRDGDGNETTCKTKDDFELARFEKKAASTKDGRHPDLGRKLVIECGGRTAGNGYKGPVIWDRWEDE